jgi:hypothetical protein
MADTSLADLKRGIVGSEPAAERARDAAQLLSIVLLRDDARVQQAFSEWRARHGDHLHERVAIMGELATHWQAAQGIPQTVGAIAADHGLLDDMRELKALTADLGLGHYGWLPQLFFWEFARAALGERDRDHRPAKSRLGNPRETTETAIRRDGRVSPRGSTASNRVLLPLRGEAARRQQARARAPAGSRPL